MMFRKFFKITAIVSQILLIFYFGGVTFGQILKLNNNAVTINSDKTLFGYNVKLEHHTADDVLTLTESNSMHTNFGEDGEVTLTLPTGAGAGCLYRFVVMAGQELRVKVSAAAEIIYANGVANTDDGGADLYIGANAPGEAMTLVSDGNGDWVVVQMTGTWTATQP